MDNGNNFRLRRLVLRGNPIFSDIDIDFTDHEDSNKLPYISLIIGPNGTGKSNLLRIIIDLFRQIYDYEEGKNINYVSGAFYLEYSIGDENYLYYNFGPDANLDIVSLTKGPKRLLSAKRNGDRIKVSELEIPKNLLASSIMLTDKFYYTKEEDKYPYYHYLGVRTSSNQSGTLSYIRKSIELMIETIVNDKRAFLKKFKRIFNILEFDLRITIRYRISYKDKFFSGSLTQKNFKDIFKNWKKNFPNRKTAPYGHSYFTTLQKNDPEKIKTIVGVANKFRNEGFVREKEGTKTEYLTFDLIDDKISQEDWDGINELNKLDILRTPSITFYKNGIPLSYKQSSSGEQHIVTTLIGLMSKIEQGSLILLDEPEISLHPNWQMRYVNEFITELFKEYTGCHFLIATHSHFLASDIRGNTSKIIGLNKTQEKIENIDFGDIDTFGWSAEQILYKIFNVKSTRNYYLEVELRELLYKISQKSQDFEKMNRILSNLKELEITESDPLNLVINQAERYLSR